MEGFIIVLFIILVFLVLSIKSTIKKRFDKLELDIQQLKKVEAAVQAQAAPPEAVQAPPPLETRQEEPPPQAWASGFQVVEEKSLSDELSSILQQHPSRPVDELASASFQQTEGAASMPSLPQVQQQPHRPTFLERNPDLEKFIGENLISKIGIAILVLAIGFFVKYAIDNEWIGPIGRVGIGILCGGILVGVAHRLRNNYKAFSSVLVGGGLAVFYFTITLAYHQFHLFSQLVSFVIMVVITAFAVVLSQLYNRQELAVIALVGGFATPFMVSSGSGNYQTLFAYLLILNGGLLVIAYNKAWRLLNLLAFLFTVILFSSWLLTLPGNVPSATYRNGLLYASAFYVMFFAINIAHNTRQHQKFIASDFGILLCNTGLYFAAGLYCLTAMKAGEYRGLFTASLGAVNLAASFLLFRNRKIDKNILYLLIGITLSFISLTAPIQLSGHNITLFWASEAVLLYWLFLKSRIPLVRIASLVVWVAMLVSLFMDWINVYSLPLKALPVVINKGFITTIFAALASYLLFVLRKNEAAAPPATPHLSIEKIVFRSAGILLLFLAGAFEINHQFHVHYPGTGIYLLYLLLYCYAFVQAFIWLSTLRASLETNLYVPLVMLVICVLLYFSCTSRVFDLQEYLLANPSYRRHFVAHWLGALVFAINLFTLIRLISGHTAPETRRKFETWLLCFTIVVYLSAETHLLVNAVFYTTPASLYTISQVFTKTGLPILWGLCSFAFMWTGMRFKFRSLRIVSLTLFTIILAKLFLFDIRHIPVAGKIAAFFSLGILLLVVSFMYQRLKKIIIEDEKKPSL